MDRNIAIIGIAGRFPEADSIEQLYENLRDGRDSIREISRERRLRTSLPLEERYKPAGYIEAIDLFDHSLFNLSLGEAQNMAPQQRLMLEVVYETIENAGYAADALSGTRTAVFMGDTRIEYYRHAKAYEPTMFMGNHVSAIAGRVARFFNLAGAAAMVDSSCSSSMVALHLAVNELLLGEADYALACGVNLNLFPDRAAGEYDIGIKSPDGKTRCFSADAAGTGSGEAVIAVLLKPLANAVADRDHIHAVIKSVAVNQVAARSANLTAPDAVSQSEVIRRAWEKAEVDASSIQYIEAHGTATKLGDPIEVEGLDLAFRATTSLHGFCTISSIKSNIGHTWSAAGLAGVVKAVQALKYGMLFPSVNCGALNPLIDFANSAVTVNRELRAWPRKGTPRRAGVSSFGIMGTNAHCVLEEAPAREPANRPGNDAPYWAPFSGRTPEALGENMSAVSGYLRAHPEIHPADVSFTLLRGRKHHAYRFAAVFHDLEELTAALDAHRDFAPSLWQTGAPVDRLVLVFSGLGDISPELLGQLSHIEELDALRCRASEHLDHASATRLAVQFAIYRALVSRGLETRYMLGDGVGKSVTGVISGRIGMQDIIADAARQTPGDSEGLSRRVTDLLKRDMQHGRTMYAEAGPMGNITQALLARVDPAGTFRVAALSGNGCLARYMAELYGLGVSLNFERAAAVGDRIELPSYRFSKVRCWMETREEPEPTVEANAVSAVPETETDISNRVRRIWADVLKAGNIADSDSFFDLGGHSINAVQVLNQIEKSLGVKLSTDAIFEYDTVASLSAQIELLVKEQQGPRSEIPTAPQQADYGLSHRQQRVWLASQFRQGSVAYNLQRSFRITGALDVPALEQALCALVGRHESLRTTFPVRDGKPRQRVLPPESCGYRLEVERTGDSCDERLAAASVSEFTARTFDLERGPMFRAKLIKLGDGEAILSCVTHHLVCDGWSLAIFARDLGVLYEAARLHRAPKLPQLRVQYKDFADSESIGLARGEFENSRAYWERKLDGAPPGPELPFQLRARADSRFTGEYRHYEIRGETWDRLRTFARTMDTTTFVVTMSAWSALLARYCGINDIVVGTSLSGRTDEALHDAIGMYVNTVPIRVVAQDGESFESLVRQVRQTVLEALSHQRYPFSHYEEKHAAQDTSRSTSRFDILIEFQQFPHTAVLEGTPLKVANLDSVSRTAINGINIMLSDAGDSLRGDIRFDSARFDGVDIDRMWTHFATLLAAVLADSSRPLAAYDYVSQEEKALLLRMPKAADWNERRLVHHCFEDWAQSAPSRVCFRSPTGEITFSDLNASANRIARWLAADLAVQPEQIVGVWMDRGIDLAAAILAIWKCGCAYLPLDPEYPAARTREILQHARCSVVLGSRATTRSPVGIAVAYPPDDLDMREPPDNLGRPIDAEQLAYVIYTSGSTGAPKGVMIEHRGMLNHLHAKIVDLALSKQSVIVQNASQCFDISVWQLFAAPMVGGKTTIYSASELLDPERMTRHLHRDQVSVLEVVPSYLAVLLDLWESTPDAGPPPSLEYLVATGETLPPSLVKRWFGRFPGTPLVNAYGPTEASDDVTHHFMHAYAGEGNIPIGSPIQNTRIYVLDAAGMLCPQGVTGELCVSGVGVGRGYLHEPGLTSGVFMPDPFVQNTRMYRTGDRGFLRRDGAVEFEGRVDSQVKVRGFRIEIGEVERRLCAHPAVRAGAVVVASDRVGSPFLRAFSVLRDHTSPDELKAHLRRQLPEYMVPAQFVQLAELPLNLNGKIDRKRLASQEYSSPMVEPVSFATPLEQAFIHIWERVLGRTGLGALSDFFEAGGNSLKAVQIVTAMRKELRVEVDLETLFANPTVRQLALALTAESASWDSPIPSRGGSGRYEIACTQALLLQLEQAHGAGGRFNRNDLFVIRGRLNPEAIAKAFELLLQRHESLRTVFVLENGAWQQEIRSEQKQPAQFRYRDLRETSDANGEADRLINHRLRQSFDLQAGPLIRSDLICTAQDQYLLLVSMCQLISDGRSVEVLVRDWMQLYASICDEQLAAPEPLEFQYKDYCHWRNVRASASRAELDRAFWKNELAGAPSELPLPRRDGQQTGQGVDARTTIAIAPDLMNRLLAEASAHQRTPFVTFLGATGILLSNWLQVQDLVTGTYTRGRDRPDLLDQIGFFLNTVPLRIRMRKGESPRVMLARLQRSVLEAFKHQEYPYQEICRDLQWVRSSGRHPLFDVMVAYDEVELLPRPQCLEGLTIEAAPLPGPAKEADLLFTLRTTPDQGASVVITWNSAMFAEDEIRQRANELRQTLEAIADQAGEPGVGNQND